MMSQSGTAPRAGIMTLGGWRLAFSVPVGTYRGGGGGVRVLKDMNVQSLCDFLKMSGHIYVRCIMHYVLCMVPKKCS